MGHDSGIPQIRDVWAENLEKEISVIRELIIKYPYVAMDTEFPGIVARPLGNFRSQSEFVFQTLRCNVDLLKIIQLGITLADEKGKMPPEVCTWQFNFKFNLDEDTYAQESIDLLTHSGIDFELHQRKGIDVNDFGELLMTSGLVLVENVKWITFHSGYDFGYLLKVLTANPLPADDGEFFELLKLFFPSFYDIKYLMRTCKSLKGGLQDIASDLKIERIGIQHQAGSDSLLTCKAFFKIRHLFFEDTLDDSRFSGFLYGLGGGSDSIRSTPLVINPNESFPLGTTPPNFY